MLRYYSRLRSASVESAWYRSSLLHCWQDRNDRRRNSKDQGPEDPAMISPQRGVVIGFRYIVLVLVLRTRTRTESRNEDEYEDEYDLACQVWARFSMLE